MANSSLLSTVNASQLSCQLAPRRSITQLRQLAPVSASTTVNVNSSGLKLPTRTTYCAITLHSHQFLPTARPIASASRLGYGQLASIFCRRLRHRRNARRTSRRSTNLLAIMPTRTNFLSRLAENFIIVTSPSLQICTRPVQDGVRPAGEVRALVGSREARRIGQCDGL